MTTVELKPKSGPSVELVAKSGSRELARPAVRMKYDAAQTTPGNTRHWQHADELSAGAANSEVVRRTLRSRSRYEAANNPWYWGMVDTIVEDTLGTGARIQLRSERVRNRLDEEVEAVYRDWHEANEIDDKANLLRRSKIETGEVFGTLTRGHMARSRGSGFATRPAVELGVQIIEGDQCMTPGLDWGDPDKISGIEYDRYGNPAFYHILKHHPGALGFTALSMKDARRVPAELVIHYFNRRRPGDARGIPETTPALPLFALLRRMTLASVESSEHIANIAGMLYTDAPVDAEASEEVGTLDTIDFERGSIMTLPFGWKYQQADPKQPATTYAEFRDAVLNEIARAMKVPFNVAAGNSSGYNYSSGRLDFQAYHRSIRVERSRMVREFYDRIFWAWFDEASRINGLLPQATRTIEYRKQLRTKWFFDGFGHVDPVKEAQGEGIRLDNGTTTLAEECAAAGRDWREVLDQQAEENKYRAELGLAPRGQTVVAPTNEPSEEDSKK